MGKIKTVNLRIKIIIIATGVMLFAIGAVIAASGRIFSSEYKTALQSRSIAIGKSLKIQLERLLQLGIDIDNLIGFEEQCREAVDTYEGISFAMVVEKDGKIVFHNDPGKQRQIVTDHNLLKILEKENETITAFSFTEEKGYSAIVPVYSPGNIYQASIVIGFPVKIISDRAGRMIGIDLGVGLAFLGIGTVILIGAITVFVTQPLSRLVHAMKQIRENTTDLAFRVPVKSADEIGQLSVTFNELMNDLQSTTVSKDELSKAHHELIETEEKYRRLVETSPNAIFVDCENRLIFVNPEGVKLLGAKNPEQILGSPLLSFIHPDSLPLAAKDLRDLQNGHTDIASHEVRMLRLDGTTLEAEVAGIAFVYNGKPAAQLVVKDITDIKQIRAKLEIMATQDILTGLPNRHQLMLRLNESIEYSRRYKCQTTVLFIDLDNFKTINDSLGHNEGDFLLKTISERLVNCIRAVDTVGRIGGDEFVVVLFDQPKNKDGLSPVLERIRRHISMPIMLDEQEFVITCSIGFAIFPNDGNDSETLLRNADVAMYRVKELGRNNIQAYSEDMQVKINKRLLMQANLQKAIEHNELILHYQPQLDLRSGKITAVEALVRWNHPVHGIIPPSDFIPISEETGQIVPLGEWVVQTACRQNKEWQKTGLPPVRVAVNISARQLKYMNLADLVRRTLHETGLDAGYLELELTESLIIKNLDEAEANMTSLRNMGVSLAIDDFGTGYSSLSSLKRFPISRLKIAQAFVHDIPDDEENMAISISTIALGHSMKMKVVAEGVETEVQKKFFLENSCDEIQGYLISKPVPPEMIPELLEQVYYV